MRPQDDSSTNPRTGRLNDRRRGQPPGSTLDQPREAAASGIWLTWTTCNARQVKVVMGERQRRRGSQWRECTRARARGPQTRGWRHAKSSLRGDMRRLIARKSHSKSPLSGAMERVWTSFLRKSQAKSTLSDGMGSNQKPFSRKSYAKPPLSDGLAKFLIALEGDQKLFLRKYGTECHFLTRAPFGLYNIKGGERSIRNSHTGTKSNIVPGPRGLTGGQPWLPRYPRSPLFNPAG